jgi:hypothetical protein
MRWNWTCYIFLDTQKVGNPARSLRMDHHIYFIARNPYTRLLSVYLNKVARTCLSETKMLACANASSESLFDRDITLKEFVEFLHRAKVSAGNASMCMGDHHLCQQVESCVTTTFASEWVTVLKLEDQGLWFPCLVDRLHLNKSVLEGDAWMPFSQNPCYYTATGDCRDMLHSAPRNDTAHFTDSAHATGASSARRLLKHYDQETAALVTSLYADDFLFADDFRALGYPIWNGTGSLPN